MEKNDEVIELRKRLAELQKELKEKEKIIAELRAKASTASLFEFSEKGLRLKLYRMLLKKYAPLINKQETKTVGEIKGLINKDDLTIQSLAEQFKPENYSYEKHFLQAAKKAFEFVKKEIRYVKPDVELNFWLTPSEILASKVADDEDLAVFLCSILFALGSENASVIIAELDDLSTRAFVVFEFDNKAYFLDPAQEHEFDSYCGSMVELFQKYNFKGARIKRLLYKFNHFEYRQFIE